MFTGLSSGNSLGLKRYMYDANISLLLMLTNVAVVILHQLLKEHRYCNISGTLLTSCLNKAVTTTAMEKYGTVTGTQPPNYRTVLLIFTTHGICNLTRICHRTERINRTLFIFISITIMGKAPSSSCGQEILYLLHNPTVCYQVHNLPLLFLYVQLYYYSTMFTNISLILQYYSIYSCYPQCPQPSLPLGQETVPHPHKKVTLCFIFSETAQSINECQQAFLNNNSLEHVTGLKLARILQHFNMHKTTNNL
jgi:hypothetical protein